LVLKVLVGRDKQIKARSSQLKQLTVLSPGPPNLGHGGNLVAGKGGSKSAR
jgi:hypothetical protein